MKLSVLASGSSGNALYIESAKTKVLVDVGLSGQEVSSRLESIGVPPESIQHIVLTHEHSDHLSGVGIYARRNHIPVYIHPQAHESSKSRLGRIEKICFFDADETFRIEDIIFEPFLVSHDAVSPVGFCMYTDGIKTGLVTDLGIVTKLVVDKLKNSDILIIESNHDEELLMDGPYPWYLKQRIRSNQGHLSNAQSNELLEKVWHDNIKHLYLAHLSEVNNSPQIAYSSALNTIKNITDSDRYDDILKVSSQHEPTCPIKV